MEFSDNVYSDLPKNPYPKHIFTMKDEEFTELFPDEELRTRIAGYLMGMGWQLGMDNLMLHLEYHYIGQSKSSKILADEGKLCAKCGAEFHAGVLP